MTQQHVRSGSEGSGACNACSYQACLPTRRCDTAYAGSCPHRQARGRRSDARLQPPPATGSAPSWQLAPALLNPNTRRLRSPVIRRLCRASSLDLSLRPPPAGTRWVLFLLSIRLRRNRQTDMIETSREGNSFKTHRQRHTRRLNQKWAGCDLEWLSLLKYRYIKALI